MCACAWVCVQGHDMMKVEQGAPRQASTVSNTAMTFGMKGRNYTSGVNWRKKHVTRCSTCSRAGSSQTEECTSSQTRSSPQTAPAPHILLLPCTVLQAEPQEGRKLNQWPCLWRSGRKRGEGEGEREEGRREGTRGVGQERCSYV